jgi:phosphoesterase RecJ-like protein
MMMSATTKIHSQIVEYFDRAESILITAHADPDGDSIGTQLALARYLKTLGKKVEVVNQGMLPDRLNDLPAIEMLTNIDDYKANTSFDLAVFLECSNPERAGSVVELISEGIKIINIDHHPDKTNFGDIVYVNSKAAAVGEMVTEFFMDIGFQIDADIARLLYTGILTDTGRFRFNSTTRRTMEIAGYLIECGADPRNICDDIYYSISPGALKLTGRLFLESRLFENDKICFISVDNKLIDSCRASLSDTDGMAEFTLYIKGVVAGAMFRELDENNTKVSLRSRGAIDVGRLANKYSGGGHANASGCTINLPMRKAEEVLLSDLKELTC